VKLPAHRAGLEGHLPVKENLKKVNVKAKCQIPDMEHE
jgi:hypothetical protein